MKQIVKCIKIMINVSSIHYTARSYLQDYTLLISYPTCTISTYLTDYNVHKLNSADDCLRASQKHKLTALHSYYRLVNTVQPAHMRSHNTQRYTASTSQYRHNTQAATHKILLRSSKRTRRINTQNSLFDSHISLIFSHIPYI